MRKILHLLSFFILFSVKSFAQTDTSFWFVAPDISSGNGDQPVFLRIMTYGNPSTVVISQPANGSFTPITKSIPANSVDSVNLTSFLSTIENDIADLVLNRGIRISATQPVSAFYELRANNNREFFTLKGQKGLGTDFYTPFQNFWNTDITTPQSHSSIEIVASQNNTTVLITPKTDIIGHNANVTYSIVLNAGETYSAQDTNAMAASSLSGSIISSDKPVAVTVFSGAISESGCMSSIGDQITTAINAGTGFIIHRAAGNNERVYIVATQNNTSIDIFGSATSNTVINSGETAEYVLADTLTYIKTNKPVYTFHTAGFGCSLSGAQVPNLVCAGSYNTAFTRTSADTFALSLYVRSGFEGSFKINGASGLINASAFKTVPGTNGGYRSALIYFSNSQLPVGAYYKVSNSGDIFGLGILEGNPSIGSSYGYLSDFISSPFVHAGNDTTVCANKTLTLNGIVGGGSTTGNWSGTGFGTFQNGLTALSNVYIPSSQDTTISPVKIILSSTGPCAVIHDTLLVNITPAPIVNASADQTICGNTPNAQLNGSVTGGASSGFWTTTGSGSFTPSAAVLSPVYHSSNADTSSGIVRFIFTSTNFGNCAAVADTMFLTITNSPSANAGPSAMSVCSNNASLSLNGVVSGATSSGKWTSSGTGIFNPDNLTLNATYSPSASDISNGSLTIHLTSTNNGTCIAASDSINVTFTSSPVANAGTDSVVCANNALLQLNGIVSGPTNTGVWSGGTGTFTPNNTALNATYLPSAAEISAGMLTLTLSSTAGGNCSAVSDNVKFNFTAPPSADFSSTGVCAADSNSFTSLSLPGAGSINSYDWRFGDGGTSAIQNPHHTYAGAGSFITTLIVGSTSGCSDTIQKAATVHPIPVAGFNYVSLCNGSFITVNFNDVSSVAAPDSVKTWHWDFGGAGQSNLQNPPPQFFNGSPTVNTSYSILFITASNFGCSDSSSVTITIPPHPVAGFNFNTTTGYNVGATVAFSNTSTNGSIYSWNFGDGSGSNSADPTHTFFSNGNFIITQIVSDSVGCSDTAVGHVNITTVKDDIVELIPNAISPNGDGKNDVWKLPFISLLYPKTTVEIFNEWGEQVFYDDKSYTAPWDGTYSGNELPAGSYFYIINLNDPSKPDLYKGAILLVR